MSVTLSVRFPLGRYHATAWDQSVNEGGVEWPPSPWRILRALVATWYNRWPDLPAPILDALLVALGDPPSYWTATGRHTHTRHYMPSIDHKTGGTGSTNLTLDPFVSLPRSGEHLLVRWDTELSTEHREVLAKLVELVPYLGRAESVCDIRVVDDVQPDGTWWRPGAAGEQAIQLLAPQQPISRPILELTTLDVRKQRRTLPERTAWLTYARTPVDADTTSPQPRHTAPTPRITAIRFAVHSTAPFKATNGVLLADRMHALVANSLDGTHTDLLGRRGATTNHQHAHWIPVTNGTHRGASVDSLLIWAPAGLTTHEVTGIIAINKLSGRRGTRRPDDGYEVKGFPDTKLLLQAVGTVEQIAPELCRPARHWRSLTPYLPVRHQKRTPIDEYLIGDVRRELQYRGISQEVEVARSCPDVESIDRWALEYRRYREKERLTDARTGHAVQLTFNEPVAGPIVLGQLSHFGYGIFTSSET